MKRCLILLLTLPLVGCHSDQKEQLARCVFDSEINYPSATWRYGDDKQSYVWLCMAVAGYALNPNQTSCRQMSTPTQEATLFVECYQPRAKVSYLFYRLGQAFGR